MPRNSSGVYSLPAGNPVIPDTLIESTWANPTMSDIGQALTDSLPRNGAAPMTGPLILSTSPITQARQAVSKVYVDSFLAYATGMPIAAISPYAGSAAPPGWLLCDGQAVGRTEYPELFAAIGTIYGEGDNATTFNVPDLRNEFIRGLGGSRTLGSKQIASFASHTHGITDPGHAHGASSTPVTHDHGLINTNHSHGVNDPGHSHNFALSGTVAAGSNPLAGANPSPVFTTSASGTGISIKDATLGAQTDVRSPTPTITVNGAATGITTVGAGGSETVPQNMALNYYIKAIKDGTSTITPVLAVESSDTQMISINETNPSIPVIQPQANVPFGIPKLDANAKVPLAQIPNLTSNTLGYFNASSGALPVGTFASGDQYIISVGGTLTLYDPVTLVAAPTAVTPGQTILYITNSPTNPTGWYAAVAGTSVIASQVAFTPVGDITSTNVQAALAELDADVVLKVSKTSNTGSALLPAGTDAQRDATPAVGAIRFSSTNTGWEGWNGTNWVSIGGGQMLGQAVVKGIFYNAQSIAEDVTIAAGTNGLSAGPIEVTNGFTVTVSAGSTWSVT